MDRAAEWAATVLLLLMTLRTATPKARGVLLLLMTLRTATPKVLLMTLRTATPKAPRNRSHLEANIRPQDESRQ